MVLAKDKTDTVTVEEGFHSSLSDVAEVLEKLGGLFETTLELHEAVTLALTNGGQLKLLMSKFETLPKK